MHATYSGIDRFIDHSSSSPDMRLVQKWLRFIGKIGRFAREIL